MGTGQNKSHIPFSQQTNFLRYTRSQMDFPTVGTRTRDSTLKVLESNPKFPQGPNQPVRLVGGGRLEMKQILESRPKQEKIFNQESILPISINVLFYATSLLSPGMAKHLSAEFSSSALHNSRVEEGRAHPPPEMEHSFRSLHLINMEKTVVAEGGL